MCLLTFFFFFYRKTFVSAAFWGSLISILIFIFMDLSTCTYTCPCHNRTRLVILWGSFLAGSPVTTAEQDAARHADACWMLKKNLSLHHSSSLQRSFKQTSVFLRHALRIFQSFFFFFFFCKTPGCCLQPSGHSPTQSRFVKCRTDCCLSRKFSCSSQGNAVVQLDRSLDLSHLHRRGSVVACRLICGQTSHSGKAAALRHLLDIHKEPKTLFQWTTLNSANN